MASMDYKIFLTQEPEGGFTVTVPALKGVVTHGDNIEQAIEMAKEAIELYIEGLIALGKEIPTQDDIREFTVTVEAHA